VRTPAGSAAWSAFQHGWRWTDESAWTRLTVGQTDPVRGGAYAGPDDAAALRPGDLLVVDEAGMLDQDTARALLTVADECQVRLALLGDRHQLAAVGPAGGGCPRGWSWSECGRGGGLDRRALGPDRRGRAGRSNTADPALLRTVCGQLTGPAPR
jgi:hypothetical protein